MFNSKNSECSIKIFYLKLCKEKNWKDIPINKYDQDFTFIVDGKKYSTPRFVADLLSPKIKKLHYTDESVNESQEDHFTEFLDLTKHENKLIDHTNQSLYSTYFLQLGNIDEYIRLLPTFSSPVATDNAIPRLIEIQQIIQNGGELIDLADQSMKALFLSFQSISQNFPKRPLSRFPSANSTSSSQETSSKSATKTRCMISLLRGIETTGDARNFLRGSYLQMWLTCQLKNSSIA